MDGPATAEDLYAQVPFAPGASPFKMKGSAYVFHHQWVKEFLPGGLPSVRRALGTMGEHEFFSSIFITGGMYDLFPLIAEGYACARLRGESMPAFVTMEAAWQADKDLRLIRKWLVKLASPRAVAKRLPSVFASYMNFGETTDVEVLDQGLRGYVRAIPAPAGPWLVSVFRGFAGHVLEVNGARDVQIEAAIELRDDSQDDVKLADIRLAFGWS